MHSCKGRRPLLLLGHLPVLTPFQMGLEIRGLLNEGGGEENAKSAFQTLQEVYKHFLFGWASHDESRWGMRKKISLRPFPRPSKTRPTNLAKKGYEHNNRSVQKFFWPEKKMFSFHGTFWEGD